MNKKLIVIIFAIAIATAIMLIIAAFTIVNNNSNNNKQANNTNSNINKQQNNVSDNEQKNINSEYNPQTQNKKILIAFFSRAGENYSVGTVQVGNTEIMANNIAELTGGDLYKIEPENPYPSSYEDTIEVVKKEQSENSRPKIKNTINNIDEYDIIFIGYPIWWSDMPMCVYTFLESYDFSNKTIIPFNTHEGSGNAGTYTIIKNKLINSNVLDGLAIQGKNAREDSSKQTIEKWIKELEF